MRPRANGVVFGLTPDDLVAAFGEDALHNLKIDPLETRSFGDRHKPARR
jgi:hypothetical protein